MNGDGFYIGLMSGTSIDAVDAVLIQIQGDRSAVIASASTPIPAALRQQIIALTLPGDDHIDLLGKTDHQLGHLFASAALVLLAKSNKSAREISAIGSHGQTVRHRPSGKTPFTLQIADPNLIATLTGIVTVADFRRKDMARGGQGAPLVPAFHRALFHHPQKNVVAVNLGGIGNITWIPANGAVTGFDTGPGNGLMDAWIQQQQGNPFDRNGAWAASGHFDQALLQQLLDHPFIAKNIPKSTGREDFNRDWLMQQLHAHNHLSAEDVQATLAEFTVQSVTIGIRQAARESAIATIFVCGGGACNHHLMARIQAANPGVTVATSQAAGIDPRHVEGAAFAWLAHQTLSRQPGALASVTGADRDSVLGGIYYPD